MRRAIVYVLILWGVGCISLGLLASIGVTPTYAQEAADEADYIGARECSSCHRTLSREHGDSMHALALQDVERDKDPILADFDQGEDIRTVQFPDEDAARPFDDDDIAFVIGAGRYAQRYLYEIDRNEYMVLPAEWDTVAQTWRPLELADTWPDPAYDWVQNCAGCHTTGLDAERGRWNDDGVWCEACHGPGSVHEELASDAGRRPEEDELQAIHDAIVLTPDAQVCGQCHSRGTDPESGLPYPVNYRPGSDLLHEDIFNLAATDDPNSFWETGHARRNNMQFNEWFTSAHASALETMKGSSNAADGCVQCHSGDNALRQRILALYEDGQDREGETPPDAITLETAQFGVTCTTCHSPHEAADVDFLLVDTEYAICTDCHRNTDLTPTLHHPVMEMFEGQQIVDSVEGIPSAHFSAEEGPRCVTCHMTEVPIDNAQLANHTWRPIIPGEAEDSPPDSCSGCHSDLTTGDLQSLVVDTQASIRSRLSIAWARVGSIAVPEAGSETEQLYNQAVAALTFVQNDGSQGVHNYAYTDALLEAASGMLTQLSVPGALLQPTEAPAPTATLSNPQPVVIGMEEPVHTGFRPMTFILLGAIALILLLGSWFVTRRARRQAQIREAKP
ncbi:MAG: hypothetical protein IT320_05000 [Anaerolineae bacterium]|nr:hypothetical protein [Anaerolineae bacterium]